MDYRILFNAYFANRVRTSTNIIAFAKLCASVSTTLSDIDITGHYGYDNENGCFVSYFQYRMDYVPDWFMDKVTSNEIITQKEDFVVIVDGNTEKHGQKGDYVTLNSQGVIDIYNKKDFFEHITVLFEAELQKHNHY